MVVLLMAAAKVFESFSDIIFGKFENKERMDIVGKSMLLKAIVTTSMMGIPFFLTRNLIAGTTGLAAAFFILFVLYDYRKARGLIKSDKGIEHRRIWNLVKVSFPLGILQALVSLNGNIPLFFIKGYLGTTALGYYSSIAYLAVIGETVNIAVGQSVTPRLSKYYSQMDKSIYIRTLVRTIAASTVLGVLGLIVTASCGGFILSIFYTRDYAEYWGIFMLQMVAACSNYIGGALSNSITAARKFKIQPLLYCLVMVFNAIFMIILVPSKGLEGASYAVIISSYISLAGNLLTNIFLIWK
jgi:O-antigen/teichoic acid export membrane protein